MARATTTIDVHVHDSLRCFSPDSARHQVPATGGRTVKDLIESCGIPHPEIGRVRVNGEAVGLDEQVKAGDRVDVRGHLQPMVSDIGQPHLNRPPLPAARFIADVHLGRLVRYLRMLGIDCRYNPPWDDDVLAETSAREERIMLTRDRGLLKRGCIVYGMFLRSDDAIEQAHEVFARFDLRGQIREFTRCPRCNANLQAVAKAAVEHIIPPGTRRS